VRLSPALVAFALASSLAVLCSTRVEAQARELGSPFREGVARVSPTALPPSPGPGHVAVVLEGDDARHLHVVERRRGQDRPVCVAPCARWLAEGGLRHGVCATMRGLRTQSYVPAAYRYPMASLPSVLATDSCTAVPVY
jgi:hypothetical protein